MPEVILPCPACGSENISVICGESEITMELYHVARCVYCGMHGPEICANEPAAIAAWNAMPRALSWTHEPPKVAGDCYVRTRPDESEPWDKPFVVNFSESYLKELRATPLMQFAGPIPAPIE